MYNIYKHNYRITGIFGGYKTFGRKFTDLMFAPFANMHACGNEFVGIILFA